MRWAAVVALEGEPERAAAALELAQGAIHERAATRADPLDRNRYLTRPFWVAATLAPPAGTAAPGAPAATTA